MYLGEWGAIVKGRGSIVKGGSAVLVEKGFRVGVIVRIRSGREKKEKREKRVKKIKKGKKIQQKKKISFFSFDSKTPVRKKLTS